MSLIVFLAVIVNGLALLIWQGSKKTTEEEIRDVF